MEEKLKKYLLENNDILEDIVREINGYDSSLYWIDYFENDEYFLNEMFETPNDAVRAVCYGKYNYMDDYVRFNACGNLESCNKYEYEDELKSYIDTIIERLIELKDKLYLYDKELIKLLGVEK